MKHVRLTLVLCSALCVSTILNAQNDDGVRVTGFQALSNDVFELSGENFPDGPYALTMMSGLEPGQIDSAGSSPFFTDLGGGAFSMQANVGPPYQEQRFFRIQYVTGEDIYTPKLDTNAQEWGEDRNFTNIQLWDDGGTTVFRGETRLLISGTGAISGLTVPTERIITLRSPRSSLQYSGIDDLEVNGPRYLFYRLENDPAYTDDSVLEFIQVIVDDDSYFVGAMDDGDGGLALKLKVAYGTNAPNDRFLYLALESNGNGLLPAGEYELSGTLTETSFSANGTIPQITTFADGSDIDLTVEFLEENSVVEEDVLSGRARITQTVVDRSDPGNPVTNTALTVVTEGDYRLERQALPVLASTPTVLP